METESCPKYASSRSEPGQKYRYILLEGRISQFFPEDETAAPEFFMSDGHSGTAPWRAEALLESLAKTGKPCQIFGVTSSDGRKVVDPLLIQSIESFWERWDVQPQDVHEEFKDYLIQYHVALQRFSR